MDDVDEMLVTGLQAMLSLDEKSGLYLWRERPRHHFTRERDWKSWNSRFAGKEARFLVNDDIVGPQIKKS